jgi:hypothetical protein
LARRARVGSGGELASNASSNSSSSGSTASVPCVTSYMAMEFSNNALRIKGGVLKETEMDQHLVVGEAILCAGVPGSVMHRVYVGLRAQNCTTSLRTLWQREKGSLALLLCCIKPWVNVDFQDTIDDHSESAPVNVGLPVEHTKTVGFHAAGRTGLEQGLELWEFFAGRSSAEFMYWSFPSSRLSYVPSCSGCRSETTSDRASTPV